ncbi:MAG: hypothetical protein KGD61_07425 [Candidatus Lokiarchaeota archaeon]|nr:hypothetical protein [Candidatus Lokiarchaeota archaeon]
MELGYCPYCEKDVPYRKTNRGGILAIGIIFTIIAASNVGVIFLLIATNLGYIGIGWIIGFVIAIVTFVIIEFLYWRWYHKKLRYLCNICKTTAQPKLNK